MELAKFHMRMTFKTYNNIKMILHRLKNLFMKNANKQPNKNPNQQIDPANLIIPSVPVSNKPKFKFDIDVYEIDDSSRAPERFTDVEAESAESLAAIYATCNQRIKVLRKTPIEPLAPVESPAPIVEAHPRPPFQPNQTITVSNDVPTKPIEPKYVTAFGIKLKIIGDEVYQKQWVRVSEDEAQGIRLIIDKTNKLVNLEGKHFELEKWIKIEDAVKQTK